eukprot:scaffold12989_cov63-Cylindrotheca_fusiformis.AAC.1
MILGIQPAFCKCHFLEKLGLNEGLERIGESAFQECETLTEVNIPSTVKVIGRDEFPVVESL